MINLTDIVHKVVSDLKSTILNINVDEEKQKSEERKNLLIKLLKK